MMLDAVVNEICTYEAGSAGDENSLHTCFSQEPRIRESTAPLGSVARGRPWRTPWLRAVRNGPRHIQVGVVPQELLLGLLYGSAAREECGAPIGSGCPERSSHQCPPRQICAAPRTRRNNLGCRRRRRGESARHRVS